jgi:hypothetical protein
MALKGQVVALWVGHAAPTQQKGVQSLSLRVVVLSEGCWPQLCFTCCQLFSTVLQWCSQTLQHHLQQAFR